MRLVLLLGILSSLALAHHSYGDYDRTAAVVMQGTVTKIMWGNPHVLVTMDTPKGEYLVEWWALGQLSRQGITASPIQVGDRVSVTAAANRNPEKHILTLVRKIDRPADHWQWLDDRKTPVPAKP